MLSSVLEIPTSHIYFHLYNHPLFQKHHQEEDTPVQAPSFIHQPGEAGDEIRKANKP